MVLVEMAGDGSINNNNNINTTKKNRTPRKRKNKINLIDQVINDFITDIKDHKRLQHKSHYCPSESSSSSTHYIDTKHKQKVKERNTAQKRVARMDPEYRKREQERNTMSKRAARMDPEYRKKEQARNTESKRRARMNPEYRRREQERAKFAHHMAKLGLNPDGTIRIDRTKTKLSGQEAFRLENSKSAVFCNDLDSNEVLPSSSGQIKVMKVDLRNLSIFSSGSIETLPVKAEENNVIKNCEMNDGSRLCELSSNNFQQGSSYNNEEIQNVGLGANYNVNNTRASYPKTNIIFVRHCTDVPKLPVTVSSQYSATPNGSNLAVELPVQESTEEVVYLRI